MKTKLSFVRTICAAMLLLLTLPAAVLAADYTWTTNNGAITITGYTGTGGAVTIPDTITDLPVTSIGSSAFEMESSVTSVTIPNGVTNIGSFAFTHCFNLTNATISNGVIGAAAFATCTSLTKAMIGSGVTDIKIAAFASCTSLNAITVDALNNFYISVDGVLFNKSTNTLIQCPGGKAGNYTIPTSVTTIGSSAFYSCTSLIGVTIPNSVTSIGNVAFYRCGGLANVTIGSSVTNIESSAFAFCTNLAGVYFQGNAPGPSTDSSVFSGDPATVYYLPGTSGWGATFDGRPTAVWQPQVRTSGDSFGVQTNQFGFDINWASGMVVAVEACTDLANPVWSPLLTNTLTTGSVYFSDPDWTNYPTRFYRLRSP